MVIEGNRETGFEISKMLALHGLNVIFDPFFRHTIKGVFFVFKIEFQSKIIGMCICIYICVLMYINPVDLQSFGIPKPLIGESI